MMETQVVTNPSAKRYSEWQAQSIGGLSLHLTVGGVGQIFAFKPKGENVIYNFAFVGFGLGAGPQLGTGSSSFPTTPEKFVWQTTKLVGQAFYETGRQLLGGKPRTIEQPEFSKSVYSYADIQVESAFSAIDLNRAGGRLTAASVSASLGWSTCYITAFTSERTLFSSQSTAGKG